jgi:hypothetical protein
MYVNFILKILNIEYSAEAPHLPGIMIFFQLTLAFSSASSFPASNASPISIVTNS